jgi:hypothetical protein
MIFAWKNSTTGRPSIDPELMIRMLLVGYCYGIRSERRLCEEVNFNLAYRWFCRLGLEAEVPDHSSFSKNRHGRFRDAETFRYVVVRFVSTLRRWRQTMYRRPESSRRLTRQPVIQQHPVVQRSMRTQRTI